MKCVTRGVCLKNIKVRAFFLPLFVLIPRYLRLSEFWQTDFLPFLSEFLEFLNWVLLKWHQILTIAKIQKDLCISLWKFEFWKNLDEHFEWEMLERSLANWVFRNSYYLGYLVSLKSLICAISAKKILARPYLLIGSGWPSIMDFF